MPRVEKGKTPLLLLCAMAENIPSLGDIAQAGLGGSSGGRRRFPGLTVDDLCEMAKRLSGHRRTPTRVLSSPPPSQRRPRPLTHALLFTCVSPSVDTDESQVDAADSKGWTPLMTAAEWGCVPLAYLLLEHGAQIDVVDSAGLTALHWCFCNITNARPGQAGVVAALLEAGADPTPALEWLRKNYTPMTKPQVAPAVLAALRGEPYRALPRTPNEEARLESEQLEAKKAEAKAKAKATAAAAAQSSSANAGGKGAKASAAKLTWHPMQTPAWPGPSAEEARAAEERRRVQLIREEEQRRLKLEQEKADEDAAMCQVCGGGIIEDGNEILFCDGHKYARGGVKCGVAVHQQCYHVAQLPAEDEDWLCDACSHVAAVRPLEVAGGARASTALSCHLCAKTSVHPEGGRWQSFPLMRCRPPPPLPGQPPPPGASFVHVSCANVFEQIFIAEEDEPRTWRWNLSGQATIDKLSKIKTGCFLCGKKGGCLVQCKHGHGKKSGCTRAVHPLCAQERGLIRLAGRNEGEIGAFCGWAHLPAATFDDDDEAVAAAGRVARHAELYEAVGASADKLAPLLKLLHDHLKRRLTLADFFKYRPTAAVTRKALGSLADLCAAAEHGPPTIFHLLAVAPRRTVRNWCETSTTDGLTMVLCHTARAEAEEEERVAAEAAADSAAAGPGSDPMCDECEDEDQNDDALSEITTTAFLDATPAAAAAAASSASPAAPVRGPSRSVSVSPSHAAASASRVELRRCSAGCTAWGFGNAGRVGTCLDFCEHSPFAASVAAGYVERAMMLYNASSAATNAADDDDDEAAAPVRLAAVAKALFARTELSVSMRQMLLLLAARRVLPAQGSREQLAAARAACGACGWRGFAGDVPAWSKNVSDDVELRTDIDIDMPPAGDETWLPPFVYVIENVLYDVTPQWNVSANRAGCRCCLVRTKFCSEGCTGCKAKREECGCVRLPLPFSSRAAFPWLTLPSPPRFALFPQVQLRLQRGARQVQEPRSAGRAAQAPLARALRAGQGLGRARGHRHLQRRFRHRVRWRSHLGGRERAPREGVRRGVVVHVHAHRREWQGGQLLYRRARGAQPRRLHQLWLRAQPRGAARAVAHGRQAAHARCLLREALHRAWRGAHVLARPERHLALEMV